MYIPTNEFLATKNQPYFVVKLLSGASYGAETCCTWLSSCKEERNDSVSPVNSTCSTFVGSGMEKQIITVYIAADKMTHAAHLAVLASRMHEFYLFEKSAQQSTALALFPDSPPKQYEKPKESPVHFGT